MWPILLNVGPLTLHTYGAFVAAGFLAGYFVTLRLARGRGVAAETVSDLCWVLLLAGILGARLLYVFFNLEAYLARPADILRIWEGGLVWYGGLIAAVTAGFFWLRAKKAPWPLLADAAAPGAALGHALGRLGCFAAGCCFGRECGLPWAVTFTHPGTLAPPGIPLHPSQLYEAGLDFLLFAFLYAAARRRPDVLGTGRLALLYVGLYGLIRLAVEFTRGDSRGPVIGPFTSTQWVAAASVLAAVIAALWIAPNRRARR